MMASLLRRFDAWIFESFRARGSDLAIYRILIASFLLLTRVPVAPWLANTPQAFFRPPLSLAAMFTGFPSAAWLTFLNLLLALFICMLLVGLSTRFASIAVTMMLIVLNSWAYSLGKINHDILLVMTPLVLAFSGWGDRLSLDALRSPAANADVSKGSWCLALLALLIGICMFTAGWAKASTGWLDPSSHATLGHLVYNIHATGRPTWAGEVALSSAPSWLWELMDWFAVLFELGFLLAVFQRQTFYFFLAMAGLFHFGIWLLFDIGFGANLVCYGAFLAYSRVVPALNPQSAGQAELRLPAIAWSSLLAFALILGLAALASRQTLETILHLPLYPVILVTGFVLGVGYLAALSWRFFARRGLRSC